MNMIAFDWGGTLATRSDLVDLFIAMSRTGFPLCVISAVSPGDEERTRNIIGDFIKSGNLTCEIHIVTFPATPQPDGKVEVEIGKLKAEVMAKAGAKILIDDNPHICEGVRQSGFLALRVFPP